MNRNCPATSFTLGLGTMDMMLNLQAATLQATEQPASLQRNSYCDKRDIGGYLEVKKWLLRKSMSLNVASHLCG